VSSRSHNFLIIAQLTCGIAGYDYQSVRRWTTFKKLGYGLAECEKVMLLFFLNYFIPSFFLFTCLFPIFNLLLEFIIQIFIPVHRDVHWCLAIINMKDKTFQYLDSLGGLGHDVLNVLVSLTTKQNVTLLLEYSVWNAWDCQLFRICDYCIYYFVVEGLNYIFCLCQVRYIRDELKDKSNIEIDTCSWVVKSSDCLPLQHNGYVCF